MFFVRAVGPENRGGNAARQYQGLPPPRFCSVYGSCEQFGGSSADILHLIERTPPATAPFLWLYVGRNDPLLQINKQTAEKIREKGFALSLETDDGAHDWASWDRQTKRFFDLYVGK